MNGKLRQAGLMDEENPELQTVGVGWPKGPACGHGFLCDDEQQNKWVLLHRHTVCVLLPAIRLFLPSKIPSLVACIW
jgi:hypothetical protein